MIESAMVQVTSLQSILSAYWLGLVSTFGTVGAVFVTFIFVIGAICFLNWLYAFTITRFKQWRVNRHNKKVAECKELNAAA